MQIKGKKIRGIFCTEEDNIIMGVENGNLEVTRILELIDDRPLGTSIILTGISFPEQILQRASMITEFRDLKQ